MELRDIEMFLTLAHELHFRRTARRMYISSGRVSQTISALEKEIGAPLFTRTSRRVELTPLGERFRDEVKGGVVQLRHAIATARAMARNTESILRVGYFASVGGPFANGLALELEKSCLSLKVATAALSASTAFDLLSEGQIDVMLAWSPGGDSSAVGGDGRTAGPVLGTSARALLMPGDHPLAGRESVSIDEAAGYELLQQGGGLPAAFANSWGPRKTASGKIIHYSCVDNLIAVTDQTEALLEDLLSTVVRTGIPCLTIASLLDYHNYPGLTLVPVRDLPPCVLVPVWQAQLRPEVTRVFGRIAASSAPALPKCA